MKMSEMVERSDAEVFDEGFMAGALAGFEAGAWQELQFMMGWGETQDPYDTLKDPDAILAAVERRSC